jgi:hypothetical protein
MTLLEKTYIRLKAVGLTKCAEAFSCEYLGKGKNWYAFQTHSRRDFSIAAAVQCLRMLRQQQRTIDLPTAQREALKKAELDLRTYLQNKHFVSEVIAV